MPLRWYFVSAVFRFKPAVSRVRKSVGLRQPAEETWELHQATSRAGACATLVITGAPEVHSTSTL